MTGFGRAKVEDKRLGSLVVEMQSVNKKHAEFNINLPQEWLGLEARVKEILAKKIDRGRINLFIYYKSKGKKRVNFDENLAESYLKQCRKLKNKFNLKGEIDIALIRNIPNLVTIQEENFPLNQLWKLLEGALRKSLDNLLQMRKREGDIIARDIKKRLFFLEKTVRDIESQAPKTLNHYETRLLSKLKVDKELARNNKELILKEISIFAQKIDVTEELCRLNSHLKQFSELLVKKNAVGRSLDFIIQEMLREINTISSKAVDVVVSKKVVFFKTELEKIREQVQNVE